MGTELVYDGRAVLVAEDGRGFARITRLLTERAEGSLDARRALLSDRTGLAVITDDLGLLEAAGGAAGIYALLSPCDRRSWRRLRSLGLPSVAAGEVRFLDPSGRALQRLLVAIGGKKTVAEVRDEELASESALLLGPEEFRAAYADAPDALEANEALVDRVSISSLFDGYVFPRYEARAEGGAAALLRRLVLEGANRRYGEIDGAVGRRIEYELGVIEGKGFSDYFLVVRDIARKASRTCGRGSAAASIVSYCLGITDVDPVRHDLYFERFLNPGRKDPPDIDVDFAWDERDELLAKVIAEYGEARAARVANHVCFQPRSALREAARAYGMPDGEIAAVERRAAVDAAAAAEGSDPAWKEIASLAPRIVGFPRHLGVHSGGIIVSAGRARRPCPPREDGRGHSGHRLGQGGRRGRGPRQDRPPRESIPGGRPRRPGQSPGERQRPRRVELEAG